MLCTVFMESVLIEGKKNIQCICTFSIDTECTKNPEDTSHALWSMAVSISNTPFQLRKLRKKNICNNEDKAQRNCTKRNPSKIKKGCIGCDRISKQRTANTTAV